MKPDLYTEVTLTCDVPAHNLQRGDIATVVDYVPHPEGGEEGCILEVFNVLGDSIGVVAVPLSAIASLRADLVPSARLLGKSV
ncbi:MAG: DUF4926 domain-containing protein [Anaerolineae bacterium]|nr:DUF4926 domain-containing protein [Anaerolineae bacterium]